MNILSILLWGTLVDVHAPALELQTHFHNCNMYKGTVVEVREEVGNPKAGKAAEEVSYIYTVEHKCKGGITAVRREYEPVKLRKAL